MGDIDEELLEDLYGWVDQIPFSRPKRDIKRDFSDGVLVAEIVAQFCPKVVELHNYAPASKIELKTTNWRLLSSSEGCLNTPPVQGTQICLALNVLLNYPPPPKKKEDEEDMLMAEAVKFFFPKYVDLHNYAGSTSSKQKETNWRLLNRKVFKKLGFEVTDDVISNIVSCKPWAVEQFLMMLRRKIDRHLYENERHVQQTVTSDRPEVDQNFTTHQHQQPMMKAPPQTKHESPNKFIPSNSGHSIGAKSSGYAATNSNQSLNKPGNRKDVVPKVEVEEKEQEILVKEETIQILQAKVRRLEHLLHLKDIRIDDLQQRLDQLEVQLRPTANFQGRHK